MCICIDSDVNRHSKVSLTIFSLFDSLVQLRSTRHWLSSSVFQYLVVVVMLSRWDYGNAALISPYQLYTVASRLVFPTITLNTPLLHRLYQEEYNSNTVFTRVIGFFGPKTIQHQDSSVQEIGADLSRHFGVSADVSV